MNLPKEIFEQLVKTGCNSIYVGNCMFPYCGCMDFPGQLDAVLTELEKTHAITEKLPTPPTASFSASFNEVHRDGQ